jgi:hypothetical protein
MFEGLVQFSWNSTFSPLTFLLSTEGILSLMAFLTLFCSVFFLAVIASRLRFNDLSDTIDKTVQLSKIYNEKEESILLNNQGNSNERSNIFTALIRKHLIKGNLTLEQTMPIMEFMRFFRTLGIFTFFLIVVSGGLFVSVQLSFVLAFIMFISFLFFKLNLIIQFVKNITTQFQEFYFGIETKVFYFIWISIVACFILRSFSFSSITSQAFIVVSFLIIFLHYLLSLFIPEKLDDTEISESVFISGNRNKIILKKLYKDEIEIPVEDGPKFIVQTNFSYDLTDGGLKRRIIPIEFTDYFTKCGGVDQHFGCHFPKGWTDEDWHGFDTFIISSVKEWLSSNRKLKAAELSESGSEKQLEFIYGTNAINFIKENIDEWILNEKVEISEFNALKDAFFKENDVKYKISTIRLNKAIFEYCKKIGIIYENNKAMKNELNLTKKYNVFRR